MIFEILVGLMILFQAWVWYMILGDNDE